MPTPSHSMMVVNVDLSYSAFFVEIDGVAAANPWPAEDDEKW